MSEVTYILSSDVLQVLNGSVVPAIYREPSTFAVREVIVPLVVRPSFQATIFTSGRNVAKLAVIIDRPISIVDQIAISRVDPKNS